MDPLAPLESRVAAVEEIVGGLSQLAPPTDGAPGSDAMQGGRAEAGDVCGEGKGDETEMVRDAGDFLLMHRRPLHRIGGFHQV